MATATSPKMSQPRELTKVPDSLLLLPSTRIVSCRDGKLHFSPETLKTVSDNFKASHPTESDDIPVTILSILGEPSNEKYLLARAFIDSNDNIDGSSSGSDMTNLPSTSIRSDEDLSSSGCGINLINQPLSLKVQGSDGEKQILQWMLYLYQGDDGTEQDLKLLHQFILLASSRIAEVKFEQEQFQLLKEWMELETTPASSPLCQSFLYLFPSEEIPSDQNPSIMNRSEDARIKLSEKIQAAITDDNFVDSDSVISKLGDVNVIEMSKISDQSMHNGTFNYETESGERFTSHEGLQESIRELHLSLESKVMEKFTVDGSALQRGNFAQFMEDCVTFVNDINTMEGNKSYETGNTSPQMSTASTPPMSSPEKDEGRQTVPSSCPAATAKSSETELRLQQEAEGSLDEYQLARSMLPKIVDFYQEQMKRFLKEDVYHPKRLKHIDATLRSNLLGECKKIFKLDQAQQNVLGQELMTSFDKHLPQYREQNTLNLKKYQGLISKCQQKIVSSFMEQIETVLNGNPKGMKATKLTEEKDRIMNELRGKFESEVKEYVRKNEPLEEHLKSLTTDMNEYWEGIEERNDQNLGPTKGTAKGSKGGGGGWKSKLSRKFSWRM